MAAQLLCRRTSFLRNSTLQSSVTFRVYSLSSSEHKTYSSHVVVQSPARVSHKRNEATREYADTSTAKAAGRSAGRWVLYKYLIVFGLPAGVLFYVSSVIFKVPYRFIRTICVPWGRVFLY